MYYQSLQKLFFSIFLLFFIFESSQSAQKKSETALVELGKTYIATLNRAIDGDTMDIYLSTKNSADNAVGELLRVRLYNLDCFEISDKKSNQKQISRQRKKYHLTKTEILQKGLSAKKAVYAWFSEHSPIYFEIEQDPHRDFAIQSYDRYLGTLFHKKKSNSLQNYLIQSGLCFPYYT